MPTGSSVRLCRLVWAGDGRGGDFCEKGGLRFSRWGGFFGLSQYFAAVYPARFKNCFCARKIICRTIRERKIICARKIICVAHCSDASSGIRLPEKHPEQSHFSMIPSRHPRVSRLVGMIWIPSRHPWVTWFFHPWWRSGIVSGGAQASRSGIVSGP